MFILIDHTGKILDIGSNPHLEPDGRYAYPAVEGDLMCDVYQTREEAEAVRDYVASDPPPTPYPKGDIRNALKRRL